MLDAERYRAARAALEVLDPTGAWNDRLEKLNDSDIRPPIPIREQDASEGRREVDVDLEGTTRHCGK